MTTKAFVVTRRLAQTLSVLLMIHSAPALAVSAQEYMKSAQSYLQAGKDRSAVIELKNALQEDPAHAEARLMLGRLYLRMGDAPSATKELRRARELGLDASKWAVPLGRAYLATGETDRLLEELAVREQDPAGLRGEILALHSQAYLRQGKPDEAKEALAQALETAPGEPEVLLSAGRLALIEGDRERATSDVEKALAADSSNADAWLFRGGLYRREGEDLV